MIIYQDYDTYAVSRLRCLVTGYENVSVTVGPLVFVTVGSLTHEDVR